MGEPTAKQGGDAAHTQRWKGWEEGSVLETSLEHDGAGLAQL